MKILDKISDERNIFNAIFSLESYVFEKGLLDTSNPVFLSDEKGEVQRTIAANDLELYYALSDKHDVELIKDVIECCRRKMDWIFESNDNLFEVYVYFKLKNYDADKNELSFRPMHTARLIDMICMVSILNCLMFDDDLDAGCRNLSDLSKLLPHNFYGNIPSTDVRYLFCKWQTKYREYTKEVVEHCRAYQHDHSYMTEVSLDIKKFFPSISPKLLYDYIVLKLSKTYENDYDNLCKAVAKLLYFEVSEKNVSPWKHLYYPVETDFAEATLFMNCGIPQGLPQSYFFGNLCMIEVKNQLLKDDIFNGEAYFYVDDSVIYIQSGIDDHSFQEKIRTLNENLISYCTSAEGKASNIDKVVTPQHLDFQRRIKYEIQFHEEGKSVFTPIDDTDNRYGPIADITRQAYMQSRLTFNLDEVDDQVSLKKLKALDDVITDEIKTLLGKKKKSEVSANNALDSRLKLLRRFKKFFLFRNRLLEIREAGGVSNEIIEGFRERFISKSSDVKAFFEQFEEDIFQSEYRLLIQKLSKTEANALTNEIKAFEIDLVQSCGMDVPYVQESLFYSKDVEASYRMKSLTEDCYKTLVIWARENLCGLRGLNSENQMSKIKEFMLPESTKENLFNIYTIIRRGFQDCIFTTFVAKASAEYQRRILNVYFSQLMGVVPTDALSFAKHNSRRLRYYELRILAYLRNRMFNLEQFEEFVEHIDEKNISNQMGIDMGIMEVLNIFVKCVKDPTWVDSLIVTHRLTKGLWYNGSKFLNSYTLHNEEHAVTLINNSLELTNRIDYFVLKSVDYYILFVACYLHDISMVIHPDLGMLSSGNGNNLVLISQLMTQMISEVDKFRTIDTCDKKNARFKNAGNFILNVFNAVHGYFEELVRDNHAKDSAQFILSHSDSLLQYLEPTFLTFVAKVSESHGYDVKDVYGLKSRAKDDTVSFKYLMILIRLADLSDVANDRVNYHLLRQNLKNMQLTSKFHWISHLVTDKIELDTSYTSAENVGLADKCITETINFKIYLNFKQLTVSEKKMECKGCMMESKEGVDRLSIRILGNNQDAKAHCDKECPVLCCWMMKKHEWLVKELNALNDYLYSVNNTLFQTRINIIMQFSNYMKLDPDMLDSVQEYLNKRED